MRHLLEVIGFDIMGCEMAQEAGANRIELCANPLEGGTTPSAGLVKAARKTLTIDLYPIIRPRGGDFLYNEPEFEIIKNDIRLCKQLGCDGVVTGLLNADGTVDRVRCSQIVEIAYPMGLTFHRAFDRVADPFQAMRDIIDCGFERILTSGLQPDAVKGMQLIKGLVEKAANDIIIMPGSGLRSENMQEIAITTGATEFHTSARTFGNSGMLYRNTQLSEELKQIAVDAAEVRHMKQILDNI